MQISNLGRVRRGFQYRTLDMGKPYRACGLCVCHKKAVYNVQELAEATFHARIRVKPLDQRIQLRGLALVYDGAPTSVDALSRHLAVRYGKPSAARNRIWNALRRGTRLLGKDIGFKYKSPLEAPRDYYDDNERWKTPLYSKCTPCYYL